MEQVVTNWYKLLSGFLCLIFVVSLALVSLSCPNARFDNITQAFWVTVSCGIYGLLALATFALSTFVALIGLYADSGSKGKDAIFFKLILLVNFTGAVGMVYLSLR